MTHAFTSPAPNPQATEAYWHDYQTLREKAYGYLSHSMDEQERALLAGDIARQLANKLAHGGYVTASYLRDRCRRRAGEYFVRRSRFQSLAAGWEESGSYGGELVTQPAVVGRQHKSAADYKAVQPLRRAKRFGHCVNRLTPVERSVAFRQVFTRLTAQEQDVLLARARGDDQAATARRIGRAPGSTANILGRVRRRLQAAGL